MRRLFKLWLQGMALILIGLVALIIFFRPPGSDAAPDAAAPSDARYGAASALLDLSRAEVATWHCRGIVLEQAAAMRLMLDHELSLGDADSDHGRFYAASLGTFDASAMTGLDDWCARSIDALAAPAAGRPALLRRVG
jgi:hypothetical protein